MKWRIRNIDKMTSLQTFLRIFSILGLFQLSTFIVTVNCLPNGVPGLAAVIPPPQVLLPPHREEGQPLDEIYLLGTGPKRTVPSLHRAANINVVQTFRPPPAPPSTAKTPSSAEEITIPQFPKHRNHRKQYTKADLIAAANSLRPAGFDFNKVLFVTPQRLASASAAASSGNPAGGINNGSKLVSVKETSDASLVPLYEHVMFPLPLFDTPVFNELKPLMEMLMKEAGAKFAKFGAPGDSNKKVLVILPKSMLTTASGSSLNRNQQPIKQTRTAPIKAQLRNHSQAQSFQKSSTPSQIKREQQVAPKFIIVPKGTKLATTSKPKPPPPSSVTTTKRVLKSVKSSHTPVKKTEKGSDLQVAATSNKFSHRSGTGGNLRLGGGSSSSVDSEKRSYSISKGGDKYSFSYAVKNDEFKDVKSHSESRDGNMVAGEYSMLEPDGYTRVVRYTVDSDQGFKASVKRIPPS
ncbi:Pupal cuticle protein Edg-84A [Orchesella cincta]|uniref:Pupal cuticle protein Edg-84A n=1 Tax=Orchesella cincta TaxID=48709 RepID=A0A1D2NA55_ORCCI|nr:Pupal cuticle protein Edg-84A [Orchesella cincta]